MRKVSMNDPLFREGGCGSSDAPAIMGVHRHRHEHVYVQLAKKWWMRVQQQRKADMRKVTGLDQSGPAWHAYRKGGVGGSDAGVLMGQHRFKNPIELYDQKVAPDDDGGGDDTGESPDVLRGKRKEPIARQRYESLYGWKVEPVCVIHDEFDFMRASLDGLREDNDLLLEVKCPRVPGHRKNLALAVMTDPQARNTAFERLAPWYFAQTQMQLLVTGARHCHFVSFSDEGVTAHEQLAVVPVAADPEYQRELERRLHLFWKHVVEKTVPDINDFLPFR